MDALIVLIAILSVIVTVDAVSVRGTGLASSLTDQVPYRSPFLQTAEPSSARGTQATG